MICTCSPMQDWLCRSCNEMLELAATDRNEAMMDFYDEVDFF